MFAECSIALGRLFMLSISGSIDPVSALPSSMAWLQGLTSSSQLGCSNSFIDSTMPSHSLLASAIASS